MNSFIFETETRHSEIYRNGWTFKEINKTKIWYSGHTYNRNLLSILSELLQYKGIPEEKRVAQIVENIHGHFAFIIKSPQFMLACVDKVRSIPLFYGSFDSVLVVSPSAHELSKSLSCGPNDIKKEAALSFIMAGYVTGSGTLFSNLNCLNAGNFLLKRISDDNCRIIRYYQYAPWSIKSQSKSSYYNSLKDVTLNILSNLIESVGSRSIIVPLSGGYDSRLIASGLKYLGAKDVRCFTYGLKTNFEKEIACSVAEKLSYPWRFIETTNRSKAHYFQSTLYKEYNRFSDSCLSIPFEHDVPIINQLKSEGFIPNDAVFVNGQSGDYISGGHIPPFPATSSFSENERKEIVLKLLLNKHYSLWGDLRVAENDQVIKNLILKEFEDEDASLTDPELDYALYEFSEFMNRQTKYVITGQRSYEFLNHEWRLPLWDDDYLHFWATVPYQYKQSQSLYREMLETENWKGAWDRIPANNAIYRPISPTWMKPVRLAFKAAFFPLGSERWKRFDKRFFSYWMEVLCNYSKFSLQRVIRENRPYRSVFALFCEDYLGQKGYPVRSQFFD